MSHKKNNCQCFSCNNGIEATREMEKNSIKKYGWYAHFVFDQTEAPYEINIHTHGLVETANHKDLQICFPLQQQTAHAILSNVIHRIKEGEVFEAGKKYSKILDGYDVLFINANEDGREVLRMIMPNKDGSFEGGAASEQLKATKAPELPNFKLN